MDGSDHLELLPPYTWWGSIGDALRGQLGEITRRARESRVQNTRDGSSRTGRNNNNRRRRSQDESDVLNDEDEHGAILHECQRFYFSQRIRLIGDIVQERLIILAAGRTATELACLGCTLLGHVASIEAKLFASFFTPELRDSNNRRRHSTTLSVSNKEEDDDALMTPIKKMSTKTLDDGGEEKSSRSGNGGGGDGGGEELEDESTSTLAILMQGDSGIIFEEAMINLSNQLYEIVRPLIIQMMNMDQLCDFIVVLNGDVLDTQLTASPLLSKVLTGTAHQLVEDAQERLAYRAQRYVADEIEGYQPTSADLDYPTRLTENGSMDAAAATSDWYAPLDKTLMCLAKIYRCVDMKIFEGIARQALLACTDRFNHAASMIETRLGDKMNANLFLVKNILVLREQISPFEINFTSTETSLDFSSTTSALSTFVASGARMSLFRLDGTNPLYELINNSVPNVVREDINTKQLLETQLKAACESFIFNATRSVAQPLLDMLLLITTSDEEAYKNDIAAPPLPCTGAQVAAVLDTMLENLRVKLPAVAALVSRYLKNATTESVLLKPVSANMNEALHRLRSLMLRFSAEDRLLVQPKLEAAESAR